MAAEHYLAIDLGAGSGRVMLARFDGERLSVEELNRFENPAVALPDGLHWDVLGLHRDMLRGLRA